MTIKYNSKTIISLFSTLIFLATTFLFLFSLNFKFTKKLSCVIFNESNFTYLLVDEKIDKYLSTISGTQKKTKLEFESKNYNLICQKLKKYNDQYIYETNLDLNITSNNIAYFLINNLTFKNFIV